MRVLFLIPPVTGQGFTAKHFYRVRRNKIANKINHPENGRAFHVNNDAGKNVFVFEKNCQFIKGEDWLTITIYHTFLGILIALLGLFLILGLGWLLISLIF